MPIQKALSNKIKNIPFYSTNTASSAVIERSNTISSKENSEIIEAITLDSFLESEGLDRLDFIKLDVEGAEMEVLEGGVETIKKFKPKMAISVYHKPDDIIKIPKFICELLPEANLYLTHNFSKWNETIFFVNPRNV